MDTLRQAGSIHPFKEGAIFWFFNCLGILLFKHNGVFALYRFAVHIIAAVIGHLVDEEKAKNFDAKGNELQLLIQVLFNRLADLQALIFILVHLANSLPKADNLWLAGEINVLIAFSAVDIIDDISVINGTPTRNA